MAGKRLVMGPSPGTGLFSHDAKQQNRGRYAREPPRLEAGAKASMAVQEEERVNGQLVGILERKCAKLRQRAEEEEQRREAAEEQLAASTAELEELRQRLSESERLVVDLTTAQRDLVEDRRVAAQQGAALQGVQQQCEQARRALGERDRELQHRRAEAARLEAEWKGQVVQLIDEARAAHHRAEELEAELQRARAESQELTEQAQGLVRRYEEESAQRLELEERCITLEEKVRTSEQRSKGDLDTAQQKAKQSLQAKQRAEELSQQREQRVQEAVKRAEQAEQKCKSLEAELLRFKNLCAERGRRLEAAESREPPQSQAAQPLARAHAGEGAPAGLPPPRSLPPQVRPRTGTRPGTGCSISSAVSASSTPHPATPSLREAKTAGAPAIATMGPAPARSGGEDAAAARLPPGAIRRAGSVPVHRPPHRAPEPRSRSVNTQQHVSATASMSRPSAASRPNSRAGSELAGPDIDDRIPDEPDDSSSDDEEVVTAMKPVRAAGGAGE